MSDNVIQFPKEQGYLKPWEWLRELADKIEAEGQEEDLLMVLVTVNEEDAAFRLRADRYNATKLEVVGMLTAAAHDYNAQD